MGAQIPEEPSGFTLRVWAGLRSWGPGDPGTKGGFGHGAVGKKNEGDWPRAPGEEGEALGSGRPGCPLVPGPQGDGRLDRNPASVLRAAAGSQRLQELRAHTRAHTPREHAQCGPGNFLPSRQPPWPPPGSQLAKLGAGGARVGSAAPVNRLSAPPAAASPLPGTRHCSPHPPPRPGTGAWMSFPAPNGRVARGLVARPFARWTRSQSAQRAHGQQARWKGVCEPGDVRARTVAVTHKAVVRSHRAEERRGGACIVQQHLEY